MRATIDEYAAYEQVQEAWEHDHSHLNAIYLNTRDAYAAAKHSLITILPLHVTLIHADHAFTSFITPDFYNDIMVTADRGAIT